MQNKDFWDEWFDENRDLLIMLNSYEITSEAVIATRDRLLVDGKKVDLQLFSNIIELAVMREKAYWEKIEENNVNK